MPARRPPTKPAAPPPRPAPGARQVSRGATQVTARGSTAAPAVPKKGRLAKFRGTLGQLREVLALTYKSDRKLPLWLLAAFLPLPLIGLLIGSLLIRGTGSTIYYTVIGAVLGLLAALIVFGRRAEKAAYTRLGDSPGAAAAALNTLRKNWTVEPGIAATRSMEVVHRAVGRPGIVLVGEGPNDNRVSALLATESKRHSRVAPDTPLHLITAGSTPGRVPVARLPKRVGKLPVVLSGSDVSELNRRLKALGIGAPKLPAGPIPRGGVRMPKGLRPPPDPTGGAKPR